MMDTHVHRHTPPHNGATQGKTTDPTQQGEGRRRGRESGLVHGSTTPMKTYVEGGAWTLGSR